MKKNGLVLIITLCASLLFSSCMTKKRQAEHEQFEKDYERVSLKEYYNEKYQGSTKKEIILEFGAPNRIVDLGEGEEVLIYEAISTKTSESTVTPNTTSTSITHTQNGITTTTTRPITDVQKTTSTSTTTTTGRYFKEFYMDKKGKCYLVKTNLWEFRKNLDKYK